jgi:NAD(P)-dependent dehydrogenase (short-subunit alcohol dehydrogenase family)
MDKTTLMSGKVCPVTGANAGLGRAITLGLARMGATVVMVCRSRERGEAAQADISSASGNPAVGLLLADLSLQGDIRRLAEAFKAKYQHLHVLVNNAGGVFYTRSVTEDGLEYTFAFNHLAYFLLTQLLLDVLKASAPARIVNVSTRFFNSTKIVFADLQSEKKYSGLQAYNQSKLANILFTYELARRLEGRGVTVNVLWPGVFKSNFGRNTPDVPLLFRILGPLVWPFLSSPEKAAETPLYLATSPEVEGVSGKYFAHKKEIKSPAQSYEEAVARRLWQVSAELTHLVDEGAA